MTWQSYITRACSFSTGMVSERAPQNFLLKKCYSRSRY